jgi:hypothetical protein
MPWRFLFLFFVPAAPLSLPRQMCVVRLAVALLAWSSGEGMGGVRSTNEANGDWHMMDCTYQKTVKVDEGR